MAALGTGNISVDDVCTHIGANGGPVCTTLQECVDEAADFTFNGTYYSAPADRLWDFKGAEFSLADTTAPSDVTGFSVGSPTVSSLFLSWTAATDNVAVQDYKIERSIISTTVGMTHLVYDTVSGYTNTGLSSPTTAQWDAALIPALNSLDFYGFEYILNDTDVIIYSSICSVNDSGINFKLNVGINFEILCN